MELQKVITKLTNSSHEYQTLADDFEQAYEAQDKVTADALLTKLQAYDNNDRITENHLADIQLKLADALLQVGKKEEALKIYRKVFVEIDREIDSNKQCKIMMGLSRYLYGIGNHEKAILIKKPAIKLNRRYPGVHHYIVLASKAHGDIDGAKRLMAQAMIYEAPWDDNHQAKMQGLWHEVLVEVTCSADSVDVSPWSFQCQNTRSFRDPSTMNLPGHSSAHC